MIVNDINLPSPNYGLVSNEIQLRPNSSASEVIE